MDLCRYSALFNTTLLIMVFGLACSETNKVDRRSIWQEEGAGAEGGEGGESGDQKKDDEPGGNEENGTNLAKGKEIYDENCVSCHPASPINDASLEAYKDAVKNVAAMKSLDGKLSDADVEFALAYHKEQQGGGSDDEKASDDDKEEEEDSPPKNEPDNDDGAQALNGQDLFAQGCGGGGCHQSAADPRLDGVTDFATAKAAAGRPPMNNQGKVQDLSDDELKAIGDYLGAN